VSGNDLIIQVARLDERVDSLEAWQTRQNGSLQTMAETLDRGLTTVHKRLDRLIMWMLAATAATLGSLVVGLLLAFAKGLIG